jgi:rhodanese-related sulfurtransferase
MPITTSPEGLFLPAEDFEERFGFPKPRHDAEVVFYCKAGVRSKGAASLAEQAGYKNVGEYRGSWINWTWNVNRLQEEADEEEAREKGAGAGTGEIDDGKKMQ